MFVEEADGALLSVRLKPPTDEDISRLCLRIAKRIQRLIEGGEDAETVDEDDAALCSDQASAVHAPVTRPT